MNAPETIVTAAIVALIVTVATTLILFSRKEVATKNYVFREVSKKAPLDHTHHQSDIIDVAQGEKHTFDFTENLHTSSYDLVPFSVTKSEAKAVHEALKDFRKKDSEEGDVEDEDEPLEKVLKFEDRMLAATEAGIEATQEDILEALRNGRAKHVKTLFEDLDWLEDLHDHLLGYNDGHDDIVVTHDK